MTRKKTKPRIILVVTNDSPSANNIQPRLGQTSALGHSKPSNNKIEPNGSVTCQALANFPRYTHQQLSSRKTPPTINPNSRSGLKDVFFIV